MKDRKRGGEKGGDGKERKTEEEVEEKEMKRGEGKEVWDINDSH